MFMPLAQAQTVCQIAYKPSGQLLYEQHCVNCHGTKGEGDGPLASHQPKPPANLTTIKIRNSGEFPGQRIAEVIRYGGATPGHEHPGPMPLWAKVFSKECGPEFSRRAVVELKRYLETIQK
ncbi:MAG: c-type cytochrome [Rhodomicrobium sp.]